MLTQRDIGTSGRKERNGSRPRAFAAQKRLAHEDNQIASLPSGFRACPGVQRLAGILEGADERFLG
jgi:hypothetical protein